MMHILNKSRHMAILHTVRVLYFFAAFSAHATSVTLPYSFTAGSPISASQMMGNFTSITSALSSTVSSQWVTSSSNLYFNTGAVGIGSVAPARALDVVGSAAVSGTLAAGTVGIGTTNPVGTFTAILPNCTSGGNTAGWDNSFALFASGGTANSPAVGLGYNSSSGYGVLSCLAPTIAWQSMHYLASSHQFTTNGGSTGVILNSGATSWATVSDFRFKKNIQPLKYGLYEVTRLRPVRFDYIKDDSDKASRIGFIAQEVLPHIPEAVSGSKETEYDLSMTELIPAMVNAIKELTKRIEVLENKGHP